MKRSAILHIEGSPNPNALQFVLENGILTEEPFEYSAFAEAQDAPLARKLLMIRYVDRVMINNNTVTVVKKEGQGPDWKEIAVEIKTMIQLHLEADEAILYIGARQLEHKPTNDPVASVVIQLLNKHIRPAAQEDGGDILFESYENGVLNLSMHGACHHCPFARQTIKEGVEQVVISAMPEVRKVTANGNRIV